MPEYSVELLLEYFSVVRERTMFELEKSTDTDLAKVYHAGAMGQITGSWVFGRIIVEESAHVGQIALIRGVIRGQES